MCQLTTEKHFKLRERFHLEPLKQLIEQGYISDCVIIEIRQAIERLEADRTASRKKEDNQPNLTAFYMSSTCSNSKKFDSDTDSESTSTSSTPQNFLLLTEIVCKTSNFKFLVLDCQ